MYTYEQRIAAVNLYIKYGKRASTTIRELGYPDHHNVIKKIRALIWINYRIEKKLK